MNQLAGQVEEVGERGKRGHVAVARAKIQGTRNQSKNYLINIIRSVQMRRRLLLLRRGLLLLFFVGAGAGGSSAVASGVALPVATRPRRP